MGKIFHTYIEHSGQRFGRLGTSPDGVPIWPIEEYIARNPKLTKQQIEKLKR